MKNNRKVIYAIFSLILYQCFIYFISKFTSLNIRTLNSNVDLYIPFVPYFVYLYIFWYIMLLLVPYYIYKYDEKTFKKYFISTCLGITICGIIYIFFPTTVLRPNFRVNNITTFILNTVYMLDTPALNCFPSMHCMICFNFILFSIINKKLPIIYKILIIILSILVILSTIFIKQHVVLDVFSSFIISLVIFVFSIIFFKE